MDTNVVQRWRDRVGSYRPAGEVINTSAFTVERISDDRTAKDFVLQHHYASSYPNARFRYGLYMGGLLHGVAVFSHPMNDRVLTNIFPGAARESVELGRFVLLDRVGANGETWFLARCFELLRRERLIGVLSFSDPVPRTTAAGDRTFNGHVGTIYQAFNALYLGRASAGTLHLLPDGTVFSNRSASKVRARERNWQSAAAQLERHGAVILGPEQDSAAWLNEWLARLTRPMPHPGNHRYAWSLVPAVWLHLAKLKSRMERQRRAPLVYPKFTLPAPGMALAA